MKRFLKFKESNQAAAGIIVAILMIGLFISVWAFVQGVYVPQWMEQREAEHMDEVANQFNQLKFAIDTLSVSAQPYSIISSPVTLGSKEMPMVQSARAYGNIHISPDAFKIRLENNASDIELSLGSIKYSSSNAYYINQDYIYENGALIRSQSDRSVMKVYPPLIVINDNEMAFNLVRLTELNGRASASGYGTCPIQIKYSNKEPFPIDEIHNITIYTKYTEAWKYFLEDTLPDKNDDMLNYTIDDTATGDGIVISFIEDGISTFYPRFVDSYIYEMSVGISSVFNN